MKLLKYIYSIAFTASVSLLLSGCTKDAVIGGDYRNEFADLPAVTISGAIIDKDNGSFLPGMEVTMSSYASSAPEVVKDRKTVTTENDGWYFVTIDYNDKGDFFRISVKDPQGIYASSGIDYIGWNGRLNFYGNQFVYMSKAAASDNKSPRE